MSGISDSLLVGLVIRVEEQDAGVRDVQPRQPRQTPQDDRREPAIQGNSNSHGARPDHQIISMIKWIRTSKLSIKNSLSHTIRRSDRQ